MAEDVVKSVNIELEKIFERGMTLIIYLGNFSDEMFWLGLK